MTFEWTTLIWILGVFLALTSFLRLANARSDALREKLNTWLQTEIKTIHQKKRLLAIARQKRAQLKLQQELQAAQVAEEIKKLEISKMLAEKEDFEKQQAAEVAEKAKAIKQMRNRAA